MKDNKGWEFPPQDIVSNYMDKCVLFAKDSKEFANFRRDPDYQKVLEGGGYHHGEIYFNKIVRWQGIERLLKYLKRFRKNDKYGNPEIYYYPTIGNINHNTLLYASNTFDIQDYLGDFQPKRIVEIGGGYGGMCLVFSQIYNFDVYYIVDLPEALGVAKRYLKKFKTLYKKVIFLTPEEYKDIQNVDLTIAVFSMSECSNDVQMMYGEEIIKNSKYGFIGYNRLHIPENKAVYENLMKSLSNTFKVAFDNSITDCRYIYLERREN